MVGLKKIICPFYERKYCVFLKIGNNRTKLYCPKEYQKDFTKCPHYKKHKTKELINELKQQLKKIKI